MKISQVIDLLKTTQAAEGDLEVICPGIRGDKRVGTDRFIHIEAVKTFAVTGTAGKDRLAIFSANTRRNRSDEEVYKEVKL